MISRDRPLQLIIIIIILMMGLTSWILVSLVMNFAGGKPIGEAAKVFWSELPSAVNEARKEKAQSDQEEEEAAAANPYRKEGVMVPETFQVVDYPVVEISN